jgi:hypothetical protein
LPHFEISGSRSHERSRKPAEEPPAEGLR